MNSNENNKPRINAAKAQQNGIEQTSVFGPSAGQRQASFNQGEGQTFSNSATYAAHGQWTASDPAAEGYTATGARPGNNTAATQPKTKRQLIALTCALSLVCGIFGGVVGGGLSNVAGSGQTGMQQPGGQNGASNGASGGAAASGPAGNAQGGPGSSATGNAPSAPSADAGSPNGSTSEDSTSGSNASGSNTSSSDSIQSDGASASKGASVSATETSSQTI